MLNKCVYGVLQIFFVEQAGLDRYDQIKRIEVIETSMVNQNGSSARTANDIRQWAG